MSERRWGRAKRKRKCPARLVSNLFVALQIINFLWTILFIFVVVSVADGFIDEDLFACIAKGRSNIHSFGGDIDDKLIFVWLLCMHINVKRCECQKDEVQFPTDEDFCYFLPFAHQFTILFVLCMQKSHESKQKENKTRTIILIEFVSLHFQSLALNLYSFLIIKAIFQLALFIRW